MNNILKYLIVTFVLVVTSKGALASSLSGTINFSGAGSVNTNGTGITFPPPAQGGGQGVSLPNATGSLASFQGDKVNFKNNFTFAGISGGEQLFSVKDKAGDVLTFNVTNYVLANGKYTFFGTLTDTLADGTSSSSGAGLVYTNSGTGNFSANLTTAPEPSSLILLGTGLVTAAGMMVRRRRTV